jgi:hypothetical protein
VQLPVPVVIRSVQVPWVAPDAFAQRPPQQSVSRTQTSPGWMQNEEPSAHVPPVHRPEQQPPAPPSVGAQGLPAVRQAVLSGWQVLPAQLPLQQLAESVQAAWSAVQLVALLQTPRVASHCRLQQSVLTAQELPGPLQVPTDEAQVLATGSQEREQQSPSAVQAAPTTVQVTPAPPMFPAPPAPVFPPVPGLPLAGLPPQLGSASSAAADSARTADRETAPGVGLIQDQSPDRAGMAHSVDENSRRRQVRGGADVRCTLTSSSSRTRAD